jgi:hypothetical protein
MFMGLLAAIITASLLGIVGRTLSAFFPAR